MGAVAADVVVAPVVVAPEVATRGLEGTAADVASQVMTLTIATRGGVPSKCLALVIHVVSFAAH